MPENAANYGKSSVEADAELEAQIDAAYERFVEAGKAFTDLLAKRSPEAIRRLEQSRGLDELATFVPRRNRHR